MRYALRIQLHNVEPMIVAPQHEAGNVVRTALYIPGGVLLGFFATDYLQKPGHNATDEKFRTWFLSWKTRFENLYLAYVQSESDIYATAPIPLSTFTCKDYPGGHREPEGEEHPMRDYLRTEAPTECGHDGCEAEVRVPEGFYFHYGDLIYRLEPRLWVDMHNVVDDNTQRPEEAGIFTFQALEADQYFEGQIGFHSEASRKQFMDIFEDVLAGKTYMYLGRAKRRHYGLVKIEDKDIDSRSLAEMLGKTSFEDRWQSLSGQSSGPMPFTITLYSDTILCDRWLRFQTAITPQILAEEADLKGKIEDIAGRRFCSSRRVGGFSAVQGFPKEFDIAVTKGSAFEFTYDGDPSGLKAALQELEEWGIGYRTNEGFGTVIIDDDYHQVKREVE